MSGSNNAGERGEPLAAPGELIPLDKPSVARMHDYFLGGFHNFAPDREAAARVLAVCPDFPGFIRANRAFLRRAVQFLAAQGIRQYIDLGSGVPTVGNVHEIAGQGNPDSRVVYVDTDPVAVTHGQSILANDPRTVVLQADIRQPAAILEHPAVRALIDIKQPIGVLAFAVVHLVAGDDEAMGITHFWRDHVVSGSYLAVSHATHDSLPSDIARHLYRLYADTTHPYTARSHARLLRFFEGLELVEPGLVFTPLWRPESSDDLLLNDPPRAAAYAGVARVPA